VGKQIAMEVMGHKTRSMYRRYRIVDDKEKREALERVQGYLISQPKPMNPRRRPAKCNTHSTQHSQWVFSDFRWVENA
jgi:hypothetical protein